MPIKTDLNQAPYYDDYDEKDNYHQILFKPGVAVQVRELNQLQTILQRQIERFGDNIYKRGTIIDGCSFIFHNPLPYVKIKDVQTDSAPINVSEYKGLIIKNASDLKARIIRTIPGFEASAPNLNTLYLKYLNSGISGIETQFKPNEILTLYGQSYPVTEVDVVTPSSGFSNNDSLVFLSAISISNTSSGQAFVNTIGQACNFSVGEVITQRITNAKAIIVEVNNSVNSETTILKIKPLASDLRLGNNAAWLFTNTHFFSTSCTNIVAKITDIIGTGAYGSIITDSLGGIKSGAVLNGGRGYYVEPYATVSYTTPNTNPSANSFIDAVRISVKNYKAKVTIASSIDSVGNGIGLSVSDGIIYQKGYFVKVNPQLVVVEKYSQVTNNVVGFDTVERIIDYKQDSNLVDNATYTYNINAPGADRLKLIPRLVVLAPLQAEANQDFLPIVEYNAGNPYKQRQTTQFNSIEKELALRTYEQSGNYVLDQFLITTSTTSNLQTDSTQFELVIDSGTAYIDGKRTQTYSKYYENVQKGIDLETFESESTINYGNYIKVNQLAGVFNFQEGSSISLRDTAAEYIKSSPGSVISASGNEIGKARIRSLKLVRGISGTPASVYFAYLFDIRMNSGKNFRDVRSIFYDGEGDKNGIADIILETGQAASRGAILYNARSSRLIFPSGAKALKSLSNVIYTYRTSVDPVTCNTSGYFTVSIAGNKGEYFPYRNELIGTEKQTITVIPLSNTQATSNGAGSVTTQSGNSIIVGSSTSFVTNFDVGDHIKIQSGVSIVYGRIINIANATHLTIANGASASLSGANVCIFFPKNVPIPLIYRPKRTVTSTNTSLTGWLGNSIPSSVNLSVSFNVVKTTTPVSKIVTRNAFVKLNTSTHTANTTGPWCLGLPDIIRLKSVFLGNTVSFNGNTSVDASNFITIQNNTLQNGDVITYASATGNSVVSGLTNNQNYYIVSANSTGFKLSSQANGSAIALTPSVSATTQYILSVKPGFTDITSNFVIDHNQKKDYYDLGFLYKNPSYIIPSNRLMLVQFDVLSSTDEGLKTISSYPIKDEIPLSNNTTGIHTLEIPELFHDNGEYFDIRDCLDFRPYTVNTAVITTDYNLSNTNPSEQTDETRFLGIEDRKIPEPTSLCTFTYEKYLGRVDAVTLSGNSNFSVIKGEPSENPINPEVSDRDLLINYLIIPPYPSLPKNYQNDINTSSYLNKRIININNAINRQISYSISTPITAAGLQYNQPKKYSMKEIGSLERRISDLEYYVALSFTEDTVNNLQITSSLDTATNRFKFGFFVDNFTTKNFAEYTDPNYNAQIYGYELGPFKRQTGIGYKFNRLDAETARCIKGKKVLLPSRRVDIIKQEQATEPTTIDVDITETVFTTFGTEILTTRTITRQITLTEYRLLQSETTIQVEETYREQIQRTRPVYELRTTAVDIGTQSHSGFENRDYFYNEGNYSWATPVFSASPNGGTASTRMFWNYHRSGNAGYWMIVNPDGTYAGQAPNQTWTSTASGKGRFWDGTLTIPPISQGSTQLRRYRLHNVGTDFAHGMNYHNYPGGEVRQVRVATGATETYFELGPEQTRIVDRVVPIYRIDQETRTFTAIEPIPSTTIVERTVETEESLFNPKPSALITTEELFDLATEINSPTVDLLKFIYIDINS